MLPSIQLIANYESESKRQAIIIGKFIIGVMLFFAVFQLISSLIQPEVQQEAVRVRIVAHSNASQDQQEKILIEQELAPILQQFAKTSSTTEELQLQLQQAIPAMQSIAQSKTMRHVTISLKDELFPPKTLHNQFISQQVFHALVIEIGDAKGDNWWCALFPNVCYEKDMKNKKPDFFLVQLWNKMFQNKEVV